MIFAYDNHALIEPPQRYKSHAVPSPGRMNIHRQSHVPNYELIVETPDEGDVVLDLYRAEAQVIPVDDLPAFVSCPISNSRLFIGDMDGHIDPVNVRHGTSGFDKHASGENTTASQGSR